MAERHSMGQGGGHSSEEAAGAGRVPEPREQLAR